MKREVRIVLSPHNEFHGESTRMATLVSSLFKPFYKKAVYRTQYVTFEQANPWRH